MRLGVPALAAALLAGAAVTAVSGMSANADPSGGGDPLAAQLAAQVRAVSDPESPEYRRFRTPAQVAMYLPDAGRGSSVAGTGTGLDGQLMRSQRVTAQDALRLAGVGAASGGARAAGGDPTEPPQPCSTYFGQLAASMYPAAFGGTAPFAVCGYTPRQLRSAYDTDEVTGQDVTVAVVDAYGSTTMESDANTYAVRHGDKAFAAGQYTQKVDPTAWTLQDVCGGTASWGSEETLDVEAVHALAPHAHVLYYGANSCQDSDLLAALTDIIAHHSADVITSSWGSPVRTTYGDESPDAMARYDRLFQVAALEGITVDFSTGDCGANSPSTGCGGADGQGSTEAQTIFPASDPWVTAVGGTSVAIGRDGDVLAQTAWGTRAWKVSGTGAGWDPLGWVYGGGGGTSADFAEPWYQAGRVPATLAGTLLTGASAATPRRVLPDLALDADPFTGRLVGQTRQLADGSTGYAESAVGGTSLASPLLAGLEADAIQADGGRPLGFVNPDLYGRADTSLLSDVSAPALVHGLPPGEVFPPIPGKSAVLVELGDDAPLLAGPGYDTATGLGTPGDDFAVRLPGM